MFLVIILASRIMWRTSIARLMMLVLLLGIGMAALLHATAGWAVALAITITLLLFVAVLGAYFRKGSARAFWIGFLLFGWSYVALSSVETGFMDQLTNPRQETKRLLLWLNLTKTYLPVAVGQRVEVIYEGAHSPARVTDSHGNGSFEVVYEDGKREWLNLNYIRRDNTEFYLSVGNSLSNLICALAGSLVASYFYGSRGESGRTPVGRREHEFDRR
jgi:hypothetical protein